MRYLEHAEHQTWRNHYFQQRQCFYLAFDPHWGIENLPKDGTARGLDCTLLDTEDNKEYHCKIYTAYEHDVNQYNVHDQDWAPRPSLSLMDYWYKDHHCPCHRKQDAKTAGAVVDNDECVGERFLLKSVRDPKTGLILLSEVYTEEQLEEMLLDPNKRF